MQWFKKFGKKEEQGKSDADVPTRPKSAVPAMPVSHAQERKFFVQAESILRRLVMTSKAGKAGKYERYIFEVAPQANKIEIKKAFATLYGVSPLRVHTLVYKPQEVRFGRIKGQRKKWKKAVITIDEKKSVTIV